MSNQSAVEFYRFQIVQKHFRTIEPHLKYCCVPEFALKLVVSELLEGEISEIESSSLRTLVDPLGTDNINSKKWNSLYRKLGIRTLRGYEGIHVFTLDEAFVLIAYAQESASRGKELSAKEFKEYLPIVTQPFYWEWNQSQNKQIQEGNKTKKRKKPLIEYKTPRQWLRDVFGVCVQVGISGRTLRAFLAWKYQRTHKILSEDSLRKRSQEKMIPLYRYNKIYLQDELLQIEAYQENRGKHNYL